MLENANTFSSFSVDDLQKAKKFYGDILGLKVTDSPMGPIEVHPASGNYFVVYPKPNHVPATFTVLNFVVKNIEQSVEDLTKKGITFEQYEGDIKTDEKGICRDPNGMSIAWFKDFAGNILSIIENQ